MDYFQIQNALKKWFEGGKFLYVFGINFGMVSRTENKTEELRSDLTDLQLQNHKGISRSERVERESKK